MEGKIAIESNLTPVKNYLTEKGYNVDSINVNGHPSKLDDYDAIVVTGISDDFLGYQAAQTKAVIISVNGLSPEDVEKEIKRIKLNP